ncbi:hypothetical protein CFC21_007968 [Triticum aestivum]|uniref:Uncharacterized protein n=2 Tax=Triticum aestivum TaxID=4565 RepID=A0A9R1ISC7_WHEAT|nr:hypothetical protein CFC21_007968 [Triticum aestivum]
MEVVISQKECAARLLTRKWNTDGDNRAKNAKWRVTWKAAHNRMWSCDNGNLVIPWNGGKPLMAPSLTARPFPLPSPRLSGAKSHRLLLGVRCGSGSGSPGSGDDDAPPVVRAAVSAATELLRALSPKKPRQAVEAVNAELESPRSVEEVVAVLEADYRRAYFLTGNFTLGIYAEDCLFEDPTIKFRGRSRDTPRIWIC